MRHILYYRQYDSWPLNTQPLTVLGIVIDADDDKINDVLTQWAAANGHPLDPYGDGSYAPAKVCYHADDLDTLSECDARLRPFRKLPANQEFTFNLPLADALAKL